jgi:hypothetical protein
MPVPAVPMGSKSFTKSRKHKSLNQLLGLIQWLESVKKDFIKDHPRHYLYQQCPGASKSFTNSCKHKSIKQLVGLI